MATTDEAQANKAVVEEYIEAMRKGDLDRVSGLIAEDVVTHNAGRSPIAGDRRGRDTMLELWRSALDQMDAPGFEIDTWDVLASDDRVVAIATRKLFGVDARAAVEYQVRDGKIHEVWVYEADQYAVDEAANAALGG